MKKVLIALDYGISARRIAEKGYELAKSMTAKVTLIHVVADESYYSAVDSVPFLGFYGYDFFNTIGNNQTLVDSSLAFLGNIKTHLNDSGIETVAEHGAFDAVILDYASNHKFDVIVLGSHSHNWLEKAIMGSVTESVLAKTTKPLFIIPVKEHK